MRWLPLFLLLTGAALAQPSPGTYGPGPVPIPPITPGNIVSGGPGGVAGDSGAALTNIGVTPEKYGALGNAATYFDGAVTASSSIASSYGSSTTTVTSPSVTTVNANDVVISVYVTGATFSAAPAVANTRASEVQTSGTYGILVGDQTVASAGVVSAISGTMSSANNYTAATFPLVPSGGSVSFIASNVYQAAASNTITLTKPTGTAVGDYLVACVGYYTGANNVSTIASPAGWSEIIGATIAKNPSMVCYGKVAGSAEPGSYAWTYHYRTASGAVGAILDYRNTSGPEGLSHTLTSASANFTTSAVGDPICVASVAGPYYFGQACGTVTAVNSSTSANVSFAFPTTATGLQFAFGYDDTAAFQSMLASAPCSTIGCNVSLGAKTYALTGSLTIPPNVSVNITGVSATIPNTANAYINSNPLVNNPGGSRLDFLTTNLTGAALTLGNTLHVTSVTSLPVLSRFAIIGGAGVGLDGGGANGVSVLNWQSATFDSIAIVNFVGYGLYMDGLAGSVQDYVENIAARGMYIGFNGGGGVLIGSSMGVYIENVLVDNSVIEANGGPGVTLAGVAIQAFRLTSSTIQWNERIILGPEFYATGSAPGSKVSANYFECDATLGSNCNKFFSTTTSMIGVSIDNNFFQNPSQFTWPTYSAAGTPLPSCTTTAGSFTFRQRATVTDASSATAGAAYVSGGSIRQDVICTGGVWTQTGTASY